MLYRLIALLWTAFSAGAAAQDVVLSIGSGSANADGTVTLAIDIASSSGSTPSSASGVSAVQWLLIYPAEIVGLSEVAGVAATAAQKSVVCSASMCLAYGLNRTAIANGTLAVATFHLGPRASGPIPVQVVAVSAANGSGDSLTVGGGSGMISVLPHQTVTPVGRCCRVTSTPRIAAGGIVSAASSAAGSGEGRSRGEGPPVAAGSLVSIFGSHLGTDAGEVRVTFNGTYAPLVFQSDTQINAQVPVELLKPAVDSAGTGAVVAVVVTVDGVPSAPARLRIVRNSPSVFSLPAGSGNAALHSVVDGTLAAPASVGALCGCATRALRRGETAVLYLTGLGPLTPAETPVVLIGGRRAGVAFAGPVPGYPGVDQIRIVVPGDAPLGDRVPVQVQAGGRASSEHVTAAIGGH